MMAGMSTNSAPVLIVLAAGMGSRFGGDKQVAGVGPAGETILEFTLHDAIRAGFAAAVLVVRPAVRERVLAIVARLPPGRLTVTLVDQGVCEPLPGVYQPGRTKPWGTAHALWTAIQGLDRPCGVVNADDWYGSGAIHALGAALRTTASTVLVAHRLGNTLTPHGTVNRGVCRIAGDRLLAISETEGIDGHGQVGGRTLSAETPVSMNLWGFQPGIYADVEQRVRAFIAGHRDHPSAEYGIPHLVADRLAAGLPVTVTVVEDAWCGLTYPADRPGVVARLAAETAAGRYPAPLWATLAATAGA
jgi:hypothetical protein